MTLWNDGLGADLVAACRRPWPDLAAGAASSPGNEATDSVGHAWRTSTQFFSQKANFLTYESFDMVFFYVPRFLNHHVLKPYY
jgi:hypothetical protein